MLYYLIAVSNDLVVVAILCGLLYAFLNRNFGAKGRLAIHIGMIVSAVASVVMAYLKNNTHLIYARVWNPRIFIGCTVALLLFLIFAIPPLRKKLPRGSALMVCLGASALAALLLFYELPDFYAYPFVFRKLYSSETLFSTAFIYRFIGYLGGLLLAVLSFFGARYVAERNRPATATAFTVLALLVNAAEQIGKIFTTMLTVRSITNKHPMYGTVRSVALFTSRHENLYVYLVLLCAAILSVALIARSLRVTEAYENPAQHRRLRAGLRSNRRWAVLMLVCCVCMVLVKTVIYEIENRPPQLAEAEEYTIEGDSIYVSFAQVEDGNLHRFAYVTENNIETRFIIIKKPNSSAYGIGLDACDICGATGYYQRGEQVVCNRCDVVMNINTIGFKGGCNPIPIEYSISDGYIIVPISTLMEHESNFK